MAKKHFFFKTTTKKNGIFPCFTKNLQQRSTTSLRSRRLVVVEVSFWVTAEQLQGAVQMSVPWWSGDKNDDLRKPERKTWNIWFGEVFFFQFFLEKND